MRTPYLKHTTSLPFRFFGRAAELDLLECAFQGTSIGLLAFIGPGGQGKTAIMQHWLQPFLQGTRAADGVFLWSFYRGKDSDLFLRELHAYAEGLAALPDLSASYCVDHLLPRLRRERWVLILDGLEVVQYDSGPWRGRLLHPELGRLLEELAAEPLPGLAVVTTRFPLPELERRRAVRLVELDRLDAASAADLLRSLGVHGTDEELAAVAEQGQRHAKAVELLGTYLVHYGGGQAASPAGWAEATTSTALTLEDSVLRVLQAHVQALPQEARDLAALATAFRDPPGERSFHDYLLSPPVRHLLHEVWGHTYPALTRDRTVALVQRLVDLRLLERVQARGETVLDAHPLIRRAFEDTLGAAHRRHGAFARAGFLRGRPDRRKPESLAEAGPEIELFHAYTEAGLWNEADGVLVALDNPKHRFLAPALERDLLLRFFPEKDWRQPPLWAGFGRHRSLAIALELLGDYPEALAVYRDADAALGGDALIALGRLEPLLTRPQMPQPWQALWQAYRAHALCLAGRVEDAVALARSLVPVDIYEWLHVFECLLRANALAALDLRSVLYRSPAANENRWSELTRQRLQADHLRRSPAAAPEARPRYEALIEAYDQAGLPFERALTRLSLAADLLHRSDLAAAEIVLGQTLELARRYRLRVIECDACEYRARLSQVRGDAREAGRWQAQSRQVRQEIGYHGPTRP
jgi:hypothetical protein